MRDCCSGIQLFEGDSGQIKHRQHCIVGNDQCRINVLDSSPQTGDWPANIERTDYDALPQGSDDQGQVLGRIRRGHHQALASGNMSRDESRGISLHKNVEVGEGVFPAVLADGDGIGLTLRQFVQRARHRFRGCVLRMESVRWRPRFCHMPSTRTISEYQPCLSPPVILFHIHITGS